MIPTMHDLLDLYPDILAERREPRRPRPVKFRPVPFRPLAPEHGQFVARLCVPTRRQRFLAWWWRVRAVDWSKRFGLALGVLFVLYVLWELGR